MFSLKGEAEGSDPVLRLFFRGGGDSRAALSNLSVCMRLVPDRSGEREGASWRVLDSERRFFGSSQALAGGIEQESVDVVRLYGALGGGWEGAF